MEPRIQYAKTSDEVNIAYWTMGEGPAFINTQPPPWSNIQIEARDWQIHQIVASRCTQVRYDSRGSGLSQRDVSDFSLDAFVRDLEAVADQLALKRFAIVAEGASTPIAVAYAARNQERVAHLILSPGACARMADYFKLSRIRNAYNILEQGDWEMFADALGLAYAGWSDANLARDLSGFYQRCVDPEQARAIYQAQRDVDVSDLLSLLRMPVSIVCPDRSAVSSLDAAKEIAARIPNATLTVIESETAWSPAVERETLALIDRVVAEMGGTVAGGPSANMPGDTAIILFADIVDSTGITERLGDVAFREQARQLDLALRAVIRKHEGMTVEGKLLGDGVLGVFASARNAIEAARRCAVTGDEGGLPLHLGLHAGDVIREDGNVFGGAVNIAARIADASAPGEVLVSDTVRSLARTSAGVTFEDRGEHTLKGIEEPPRLYAVKKAD